VRWYRPYWDQIHHKMDVAGGTNDSVVRHAVEPWFTWMGAAVTSFSGVGEGPATSVAHDLLTVWLSSTLSDNADLTGIYERLAVSVSADGFPPWHEETRQQTRALVLTCLRADAASLPASTVVRLLKRFTEVDNGNAYLIVETVLAALSAGPPNEQWTELRSIAIEAAKKVRQHPMERLRSWIAVHNAGLEHGDVFPDEPDQFLSEVDFSLLLETHPYLVRQAKVIAGVKYGISIQT